MSSIIEGYNYDIFISYRQKDNKHDGWVTEFVNQLKGELEATFKEDISIYFDENPHDGLLETHSVDKSLEGKLKCLIFIPIISQTYCDSKSFAWQHEFCAFNKLSKEDLFGRDIKLSSGNVASRILPIKIHDLDPEDKTLLENELGGVLRSIEFIYKSTGVNRPLRANEDHPQDNLNKTYYRDQINKGANAIKEIITALKKQSQHQEEVSKQDIEVKPAHQMNLRTRIVVGTLVILTLVVLGYLFIPKLIKSPKSLEKTIAVLPFRNLSNDTTQLYFCDGFMEEILNDLQKVRGFTVRSRTSSDQYRDSKKVITTIGNELKANYLVEGSVGREGNNLKIWVQLIDSKADKHIWSNDYTRESKQIFSLQSEIAKDIAAELKIILSTEEKELIDKSQTKNLEAYNLYLQGRYFWNKRTEEDLKKSIECYNKALTIDPNYALAYSGLADTYYNLVSTIYLSGSEGYLKSKEYALKAIAINNDIPETHLTLGNLYTWSDWKWEDAGKELLYAIKLNPNYSYGHFDYSVLLQVLGKDEEARTQINLALDLDPHIAVMRTISGAFYFWEGRYREALHESEKAIGIDSDFYRTYVIKFLTYMELDENLKAFKAFLKGMRLDSMQTKNLEIIYNKSGLTGLINWTIASQPNPFQQHFYKALLYSKLGNKEETLQCLEKGVEEKTYDIPRINNAVQFDYLRNDPRFQALIKKMGLSKYQKPN